MVQRTKRSAEIVSPLTLLRDLEPVYRLLCAAMAGVQVNGPHYEALDRAREALAQLAADLGRPGHFSAVPPAVER